MYRIVHFLPGESIFCGDAMHDPAHFENRLFQCYDGTLVLAGCKHLLWSNATIDQADIQRLPKALRKFGDASG